MYAFLYMDMPVYMYLYTNARGSDPEMSLLGRIVQRAQMAGSSYGTEHGEIPNARVGALPQAGDQVKY